VRPPLKTDTVRPSHIWIILIILVVFMSLGDWLFQGERPICGWEGVFGHISWCRKPTASEERIAREAAMRRERDDPIEQAIIQLIRWFSPDYEP
jgi:hypothetical protein